MAIDPQLVPRTVHAIQALKGRPVIVGPWLSEIGFELLYWIPFLRWVTRAAGVRPEDLWIVSRGGCRSWYADISPHYVEILDFMSPDDFRAGNVRRVAEQSANATALGLRHDRPSAKQHGQTSFDREIVAHVTRAAGLSNPAVLHPSLMYALFRSFWRRQAPDLYRQVTSVRRVPTSPLQADLPASYVAAKFYISAACQRSPIYSKMVNETIQAAAERSDVVLLHTGTRFDDHGEFTIDRHPRVHRVAMDPRTNLETQTAVIGRAKAFIGTYGGFAYLAAFAGTPALTFYTQPNFRRDHRQVIDRLCASPLRVPFQVLPLGSGASVVRERHAA